MRTGKRRALEEMVKEGYLTQREVDEETDREHEIERRQQDQKHINMVVVFLVVLGLLLWAFKHGWF
jgi:hypothetical protein